MRRRTTTTRHTTAAVALVGMASAALTFTMPQVNAAPAPVATDTFTRTVSDAWGVADSGAGWTPTGKSSRWDVGSGRGTFTMEAAGVGAASYLGVSATDVNGVVDLVPSAVPTGGGLYLAVAARRSGSTEYRFLVRLLADGTVRLGLSRAVNGAETVLATPTQVAGLKYAAGDALRLRFQATGTGTTTLASRVWKAGSTEPSTAHVSKADSASALQRAGELGVSSYLSSSAKASVRLGVDNLSVTGTSTSGETSSSLTTTAPAPSSGTTLFSTDFDSVTSGQVTASTFEKAFGFSWSAQSHYDDSTIEADARGGKVFRVKLQANTVWGKPSGNNGLVMHVPLTKQVDNACLSYEMRFDGNFDWSMGGKLPGLAGVAPGVSPSVPAGGGKPGDKGWSARMMWRTPTSLSPSIAAQGSPNMATYYLYSASQVDYYGDVVPWFKTWTAGKWHSLKLCYTMNTVGKADGKLQAWFDGVQAVNVTNYVYRTRTDVHISHLMWHIFRGGSSLDWAGSRNGYVEFDKVRITTS